MGLGRAGVTKDTVSLAQAREAALECRRHLRAGVDPLEHRRRTTAAQTATMARTFKSVTDMYLAAYEASWRNPKHRAQWHSTLATYVHPRLGALPVASITTADVMEVLEPIWREKPETASRVRGRIEAVISFATARGWRFGENPARWRGHIANLLPSQTKVRAVEHHAALPWSQIGACMSTLRNQPGTAAMGLQFIILTAARTSEVLGARWQEFDIEGATWAVPAERMKAKREHRVPLSDAALSILHRMAPSRGKPEDFVFPGLKPGKPLSNMAFKMVLRRMGRAELTVHGFRSTFRDWVGEATAHPREVAEMALAHTVKDKTEAAYARGDLFQKRRVLMQDWAVCCAGSRKKARVSPRGAKRKTKARTVA
jgi:integrase